jgi:hypothetical protein
MIVNLSKFVKKQQDLKTERKWIRLKKYMPFAKLTWEFYFCSQIYGLR